MPVSSTPLPLVGMVAFFVACFGEAQAEGVIFSNGQRSGSRAPSPSIFAGTAVRSSLSPPYFFAIFFAAAIAARTPDFSRSPLIFPRSALESRRTAAM